MKIRFFPVLILLLACSSLLNSQTEKQRKILLDLSREYTGKYVIEKKTADSLALINNLPVLLNTPEGITFELQKFENGFPVYYMTDNSTASQTISTNRIYTGESGGFSLSGYGMTLGIWDAGAVYRQHKEFTGRVNQKDGNTTPHSHSTHVAGTMTAAGVNPFAKGMSFQAFLNAYDWSNDYAEIAAAAAEGLKISNHSYGMSLGWTFNFRNDNRWVWFGDVNVNPKEDYKFGFYDNYSHDLDNVMYNAPYLLSFRSAGNHRGEGPAPGTEHWVLKNGTWSLSNDVRDKDGGLKGYDCMGSYSSSKNIVTVGAVTGIPGGYVNPSNVLMSSFSSWGPLDDGRIKPDIVTDGVNIFSTSETGEEEYRVTSGTSTSAPSASGSAGLIVQQQVNLYGSSNPFRGATIKALIIHTADEAGTSDGPDYIFGWGLMNTLNALKILTLDYESGAFKIIKEQTLNQGYIYEYQVACNGGLPLKATICWSDPPGTVTPPALNNRIPKLINDLDVRISGPGGIYMPWVLDPDNPDLPALHGDNIRDNIEQVFIPDAPAGQYIIRVSHKGNLLYGSQDFSLVVTGTNVPVPGAVQLVYPAEDSTGVDLRPLLVWKRSARSTDYRLQVSLDSLFSNTVYDSVIAAVKITLPGNLPPLRKIFWRVQALNSGGYSEWSAVRSFTTKNGIPYPPVLIYPADNSSNIKNNSPLAWTKENSALYYKVQVSADSMFNEVVFSDSAVSDTTVTMTFLEERKHYCWHVSSVNNFGTGTFSSRFNFISALNAPDSLSGVWISSGISLQWNDNSGFEDHYIILRKISTEQEYRLLDSLTSNSRNYTDFSADSSQSYQYIIFCTSGGINSDSARTTVSAVSDINEKLNVPSEYFLSQNYPNPFNPITKIFYTIPEEAEIEFAVYNMLGEEIYTLKEYKSPGIYEIQFEAGNIPSGIYFYSLKGNKFYSVKKLVIIK